MAEVKQVDRDAAANLSDWVFHTTKGAVRLVAEEDRFFTIQAFAAHREAAEKAEREACAKLADIISDCSRYTPAIRVSSIKDACSIVADAIRARGDGGAAMDELIARDADLI